MAKVESDTLGCFDPKARQLTREAPAPEKSTAQLIQAYQGAAKPAQRTRLAQELMGPRAHPWCPTSRPSPRARSRRRGRHRDDDAHTIG